MKPVTPTCRYNHGNLIREENGWWLGSSLRPSESTKLVQLDTVFVLSLYRCPVCGYVELFDDEDVANASSEQP